MPQLIQPIWRQSSELVLTQSHIFRANRTFVCFVYIPWCYWWMEMCDNNKYLHKEMLFIWPDYAVDVTTYNHYLPGFHDDVINWKHFLGYLPFVRGIPRSPVNSPHKGQWRRALMFSLIWVWINRLSKQSWGWWFETLSCPSWRRCNIHNTRVPITEYARHTDSRIRCSVVTAWHGSDISYYCLFVSGIHHPLVDSPLVDSPPRASNAELYCFLCC